MSFIAHIRDNGDEQPLHHHLRAVAAYCGRAATAAGLRRCGTLAGLLHDLGKFSQAFQNYIRADRDQAERLDDTENESSGSVSGRVNHSAAGAQLLRELHDAPLSPGFSLIASAILSHHNPAGLVDFLSADGQRQPYAIRLMCDHQRSHFPEVRGCLKLGKKQVKRLKTELAAAIAKCDKSQLQFLLLGKFLYSCLIDADRTDSADFEHPGNRKLRSQQYRQTDWRELLGHFEKTYRDKFPAADDSVVSTVRRAIANACRLRAKTPSGTYRLAVPTGSGKTLASLLFALAHAADRQGTKSPVRRIIYVLPFTTILRQNADEARDFIGAENVLEHHASLLPSEVTRRQLVLSENWDAPVVFTTTVQFLNAFYSSSKEAQRRLHQAASSVLIFDEAQVLPIKTLHLFNHAINFLTTQTAATALICTATQPLLDKVDSQRGALKFSADSDLVAGVDLGPLAARTQLVDCRKKNDVWTHAELAEKLREKVAQGLNTLVIVNTTDQARELFKQCKKNFASLDVDVHHLSNRMCPAHLRKALGEFELTDRHDKKRRPLLCISTSLVEAGVDLDFNLVVRDLAGIVSIIQAAGRCNRHKKRPHLEDVWLINLEGGDGRPGLREEIDATERVLREMNFDAEGAVLTLDHAVVTELTRCYYNYFYHERQSEMCYPVENPVKTTMLNLLTENSIAWENSKHERQGCPLSPETKLAAAPESAARLFQVIDSPTHSVVVPYGDEGKNAIAALCAAFRNPDGKIVGEGKLIVSARPYTVNLYGNVFSKLSAVGAICEVQDGAGIYYLNKDAYYDSETGISDEPTGSMPLYHTGK